MNKNLSDNELTQLSAEACGKRGHFGLNNTTDNFWLEDDDGESTGVQWAPLHISQQAFDVAAELGLVVFFPDDDDPTAVAKSYEHDVRALVVVNDGVSVQAAARRAIVTAAAQIMLLKNKQRG